MVMTSTSLCPVTLTPFLMLVNAFHEFLCRFFRLFPLLFGFDHNGPSILWTILIVVAAEESSSTSSVFGILGTFYPL